MGSKMDSKQQNRIICPECGKIGTLRPKDKWEDYLVCYHYDKEKYQKGESPDSSCYLGKWDHELKSEIINAWIKKKTDSFKRKHEGESEEKIQFELKEFWNDPQFQKNENKIKEILDNFEISMDKLEDFDFDKQITKDLLKEIVQEIASLTNEYRKYNRFKEDYRRYVWDINCPTCRTKYIIATHFMGVQQQSKIDLSVIYNGETTVYD